MKDKVVRTQYTQEFRLEAVRQVQSGQAISMVGKVLSIPKATLGKWVRQAHRVPAGLTVGQASSVTPEQMELSRLRAEVARLRMERDIAKKAAAYFAQDTLRGTPGYIK